MNGKPSSNLDCVPEDTTVSRVSGHGSASPKLGRGQAQFWSQKQGQKRPCPDRVPRPNATVSHRVPPPIGGERDTVAGPALSNHSSLRGLETSESPAPWWTPADSAELGVLVNAFVEAVFDHRERCSVCRADGPWCEAIRGCFEIVLSWRRERRLRSEAEWLRRVQNDPVLNAWKELSNV